MRALAIWKRVVVSLAAITIGACSSPSSSTLPSRSSSTDLQRQASTSTKPERAVRLVAASAELRSECKTAAKKLGFAVPCPRDIPAIAGGAMACPPLSGPMTTACVGLEGSPPYPVFFLELAGFDVPDGYVGVGGHPVGHVIAEARRHADSPARLCIGATDLGSATIGHWTVASYDCPEDDAAVEREARHGEAAYVGHTLVSWSQGGIDYIASAHGHTAVNRDLLRRFVVSMTLVPPT
jgi:hypothetical protein